ncbi:Mo-dependent nitrogenase C-terminal domain-containing protein [uncultured Thermosynechococcus sp.]|uniref:Mo-dependent nitrogenase C-terminal domain-containing protein n=1 Tax=uncultured Thermosynechococcus sp. TaxID=436945 RepID=UPI00261662D1|nr:Mo-dependent nitrogenase C-terminal domain-containing protein [uncultured Thermosynechococcus sp.]
MNQLLGQRLLSSLTTKIRQWLLTYPITTPAIAHRICRLIPAQCPFARTFFLFGRPVLTIPPLCKLNPFYEEVMMLRFRALTYLSDVCQEDIGQYSSFLKTMG